MFAARDPADIDRFFHGLTEYAFHTRVGIVDPPLVDYVALLLVRFLRAEAESRLRLVAPDDAAEVAALLLAAGEHEPVAAREEYRQIGDATLFWSGLYPEALARRHSAARGDVLIDVREAGKRAYLLASTLEPPESTGDADRRLFAQLAAEYDLCVEGLAEVRRVWGDAA